VVLDACALANFSLCDTLLRLAEPSRLFEPKWSGEIIRETTRTLESKLGWPNSLTARFCCGCFRRNLTIITPIHRRLADELPLSREVFILILG